MVVVFGCVMVGDPISIGTMLVGLCVLKLGCVGKPEGREHMQQVLATWSEWNEERNDD